MKSQDEQFSEYTTVQNSLFCRDDVLRLSIPNGLEYGLPFSLFCHDTVSMHLESGMADMFEVERDGWRILAFVHKFRWEYETWDVARDKKVTEFVAIHPAHGSLFVQARCGIGSLVYAVYSTSRHAIVSFSTTFKVTADGYVECRLDDVLFS